MKKIFFIFMAIFLVSSQVFSQDLTAPINPDPNVRVGKLENGMTYYLRANKKPEKRAEFMLAVNAGSMQENEDQLGLAHFTEHMGFNGMEGFPGNEVVSELQKIGVAFGADLNAYTSFDETVYMVQLPTDDDKFLNMGIDILYGWAAALLFDHQEIDDERGVITEEYRMGLGADDRMRKKWFPVLFTDSRYADRLPIGTLEIIQGFKYQTIKDFYNDWYRPDLQAVIIVGDFNIDNMEKSVKEKFGKIKPRENSRPKIIYPVEGNEKPLASVCTDPEAMGNQVMMIRKFPHFAMKSVGDFRIHLMHQLYNTMINSRLSELEQNPNNPFIGAYSGYDHFVGNVDVYMSQAVSKENRVNETIESIMREEYRVLKYGFLESEFKRAKEELLNRYEEKSKEVDKTESSDFAFQYVNNYLHNDPIPGAKREFTLAKKYLEDITLGEVNELSKNWITLDNFVVVVLAPEREGITVPTEADVLALIANPEFANVEPYIDTYKEQEVVDKATLVPGKIESVIDHKEIGVKELTLSNGIKVVLKKTNFKNDEILFVATSKGGMSLYPETEIASAMLASNFVDRAGIAEIDYASLIKKMKGKKVGLMPEISTLNESLQGSTSPKDIEFFFQYMHAFFTNPRYDNSVYDLVLNEFIEQLKMIQANPMYKFFGIFFGEMSQNDPYQSSLLNVDEKMLRTADYDRAFAIYQERFANPADFIFTFVGNFDEAEMNTMLETYVASLKTTTDRDAFNAKVLKDFPEKKTEKIIYAGMDEKSWVGLDFEKEYPWSPKNNMIVNAIGDALDIEAIETIREKMGGVYSPILNMSNNKFPTSHYNLFVMFSCSPDNTDKLSNAILDILASFSKNGPKPETLEKVKEQMIRSHQKDLEDNDYWKGYLDGKFYYQDDLNSINTFEERVKEITNQDIIDFMKQYFDLDHHLKIYMYPEAMRK